MRDVCSSEVTVPSSRRRSSSCRTLRAPPRIRMLCCGRRSRVTKSASRWRRRRRRHYAQRRLQRVSSRRSSHRRHSLFASAYAARTRPRTNKPDQLKRIFGAHTRRRPLLLPFSLTVAARSSPAHACVHAGGPRQEADEDLRDCCQMGYQPGMIPTPSPLLPAIPPLVTHDCCQMGYQPGWHRRPWRVPYQCTFPRARTHTSCAPRFHFGWPLSLARSDCAAFALCLHAIPIRGPLVTM